MNKITSYISGMLLIAILIFTWGIFVGAYHFWPWETIEDVVKLRDFVLGHPAEPKTSPLEKMESDLGGVPYRYIINDVKNLKKVNGTLAFSIHENGIDIEGFHTNDINRGYFLFTSAFNFKNGTNLALVLISNKGEYIKHWPLHSIGVGMALDENRHSVLLSNDLQKIDWCSDGLTRPRSLYKGMHHSIEVAPDGTYWTHEKHSFVQLDPDNIENNKLKVLRQISILDDLIPMNPDISPLSQRLYIKWNAETDPQKIRPGIGLLQDAFHNNDVQPFIDKRFPTSLGYALAVSIRQDNLIMVIDPDTKEILWYREGLTERQHDVDYYKGNFYVYDNGPFRGYSRIAKIFISPANDNNFGSETVIDGRNFSWLDPSRGNQQRFDINGKTYQLLVNDRRGRLYVFNEQQEPVFALQNYFKENGNTGSIIQIRTGMYITEEQFQHLNKMCKVAGNN